MKPNEITWCIITAPRERETVTKSLLSLRISGVTQAVHLFAEPGSHTLNGVVLHQNEQRLGCFGNYARVLETMSAETPYICILSDDFIYRKDLMQIIENIPDEKFGFASLYTVENYNMHIPPEDHGWHCLDLGWGEVGGNYILRSELVQQMILSEAYIDHRDNYEPNAQVDAFMGKWMRDNHLKCYYHNPSASEHFGHDVSTLGHTHTERALNFMK